MAQQIVPSEKSIWNIVQTIIQLVNGRHNATGSVTLAINTTTTVVVHPNCGEGSIPTLTPATAHAAAEIGNGTCYVSAVVQGQFTITHANNAQADRTFYYSVAGG